MTANGYQLQPADPVLLHGMRRPRLAHDYDHTSDAERLDIDAMVASGDCFVTLATVLDNNTQFLDTNPEAMRPQLEKTIRTLLHLQRHYKVVRKVPEHRQ